MSATAETTEPPEKKREPLRGPFGGKAIFIGRVFGIDIGLDYSWIIIFALVTLSLRAQFGLEHEDWSERVRLASALITSLLFFACILLHELGHSITSNRLGLPIHSITLFVFGGVARLSREPDKPGDEFLIAIMGPAVSVALGLIFLGLARVLPTEPTGLAAMGAICAWLGRINIILVIFNCIPGFPLDGGRVFRSIIWAKTGNYHKATQVAAAGGSAFAHFLIVMGVLIIFMTGNFISGLWMAFIGWFLLSAARASVTQMYMKEGLTGLRVGEVFDHDCVRVPSTMSVEALIHGPILRQGQRTFFPERDGQLLGIVTLQEVKQVPPEDREVTPLQAIVHPVDRLHSLTEDDTLWAALEKMDGERVNQLPVVRDGALLGVLSRETVLGLVRARMELG